VLVWRLAIGRFHVTDGEGARLYGGRWNSPGIPVVYAATHLSLALLEQLVHLNPVELPDAFRAFAITLPDNANLEVAAVAVVPADREACRRYGDDWAASRRSAGLIVPSAIIPARLEPDEIATGERNILLNPLHPSARTWRVTETSFSIDSRFEGRPIDNTNRAATARRITARNSADTPAPPSSPGPPTGPGYTALLRAGRYRMAPNNTAHGKYSRPDRHRFAP
jgi:RES domain-containing protein